MRRFFRSALLLFFISCAHFLFFGCGGSGAGNVVDGADNGADITATLSPESGGTGVGLDVSVTAVFSDTVDEPPEWASVFTLKKDGVGDTLCTDVNYESSTNTATCVHAVLDTSSNYTASISGLSGVADTASTFTTVSAPVISSMSKLSVSSTVAGNDITLTFTFAEAAPSGWPSPAVSVTDSEGAEMTVSGCEFGDDRTTYFCTVGGVAGCTTFSDYSVSVNGYTDRFNSADDEFDNSSSLDNCWIEQGITTGTAVIADGLLQYTITGVNHSIIYAKSIASVTNFAVLTYISSVERPASENPPMKPQINTVLAASEDLPRLYFSVISNRWTIELADPPDFSSNTVGRAELYSAIGYDPPLYICFVRHDDLIKIYVRSTGESYTQLTTDNTEGGHVLNDLVTIGASWVDEFSLRGGSGDDGLTITGDYDYVHFKTTGITGESSADCPSF